MADLLPDRGSYAAYLASLEPCPGCGRVDEMDNIEGKLLCAACSLDEMAPETFEDTIGCDMCGAHIDDPCDCFDPQAERRYRGHAATDEEQR